jgi:hypothetical protein
MPLSLSDGRHASLTAFRSAYFDLKKGLLAPFLGLLICACALSSAGAIFWIVLLDVIDFGFIDE